MKDKDWIGGTIVEIKAKKGNVVVVYKTEATPRYKCSIELYAVDNELCVLTHRVERALEDVGRGLWEQAGVALVEMRAEQGGSRTRC